MHVLVPCDEEYTVSAETRYVFFNFEFQNLHDADHDNAWFAEYDHDDDDSFTKKQAG